MHGDHRHRHPFPSTRVLGDARSHRRTGRDGQGSRKERRGCHQWRFRGRRLGLGCGRFGECEHTAVSPPPGQSAAQKSLQLKAAASAATQMARACLGPRANEGAAAAATRPRRRPVRCLDRGKRRRRITSPAAASAMSPGPARPSPSTDFFAELGMDSRPSAVSFKQSNKSSSSFGRPASSSSKLGAAAISSGAAAWDDVDDLDI